MRRLGIAVWSALFAAVVIAGSANGAVPFERFATEFEGERSAIIFQAQLVGPLETGSERWIEQSVIMADRIQVAIDKLREMGSDDCYRPYADAAVWSFELARDGVLADVAARGASGGSHVAAALDLWRALDDARAVISEACASTTAPLPPTEPAFINAAPLIA